MERNFETVMIEQCSPVLAGLKAAGLFRYETSDCKDLAERVRGWNARLGEKGLRVRVLKGCVRSHWYLVYVYRESRLREVLTDENVRAFLAQEGYTLSEDSGCEPLLRQMARRLCCEAEFPHEIGIFLGYPLTDVVGFIENQGRNFTCCGCWKAYGDRAPVCPIEQVHQSVSAPVPQRHADLPPCRGGLNLTFPTNTLFLSLAPVRDTTP